MEKSMKEEWRPVRGFEDYAEVSNLGQIHYYAGKSKKYPDERFTYGYECGDYLYATIGGKSFRINRLVYMTFVGEIPDGMEVNHIDEDKHNNCVWNLNLMTKKENIRWGTGIERSAASRRGRKRSEETKLKIAAALRGKKRPDIAAALSKAVQALNPKTLEVVYEFSSTMEAQRQGFYSSAVSACCRNCFTRPGNNVYKGFIWRYAVQ